MPSETSLELAALAWSKPTTSHLEMNDALAIAFAEIIDGLTNRMCARFVTPEDTVAAVASGQRLLSEAECHHTVLAGYAPGKRVCCLCGLRMSAPFDVGVIVQAPEAIRGSDK